MKMLLGAAVLPAALGMIAQNQLYSDHMVLESREAYDIRPFIAGWGDTVGEAVTVTFKGGTYTTTVAQDLSWEVQMNCCDGTTNQTLKVSSPATALTYTDVSCGQVYVCSGQSNMELPLSYINNGTAEIAAATMPNLRLFTVPHATAATPQRDVSGSSSAWRPVSPAEIKAFSAVCYLTAEKLAAMYLGQDFPIGLIQSTWGGTRVEAWSPLSTNATCAATAGPAPSPLSGPQQYAALYNAMIAPLTRFSLRAAFWFQGEHNVVTHSSRERYGCTFGAMVNAWRDAWRGIGDFPFLFVQLAPYSGYSPFAGHGDTSTIRLAQADALPKIGLDTTGMAVTIDLGDPSAPAGDVHSRQKEEVSRRLALAALHVAYAVQEGEGILNTEDSKATPEPLVPLHYSGPALLSAQGGASQTTLTFGFAGGANSSGMLRLGDTLGCKEHRGIDFHGNAIGGECCAAHDTFQLCTGSAAVSANSTELSCANATSITLGAAGVVTLGGTAPGGAPPTVVRHAYANYPQCALYNEQNLPASPFVAKIQYPGAAAAPAAPRAAVGAARSAGKNATPPMGVNSWNSFHCNVDERKMRGMADALVSTGLAKVGYNFLNIDDCWQVERSPDGTINADPARFPGGIKPLVDYAHSQGIKFGIYSAQKQYTCQRRPGSYQHEAIDVQTYCDWGIGARTPAAQAQPPASQCALTPPSRPVRLQLCHLSAKKKDYIKLDQCAGKGWPTSNTSWIKFRAAVDVCFAKRKTPMVLSVESCDDPSPGGCGGWIGNLANLWRTCGDIQGTFASVMRNVVQNTKMARFQGPTGGPVSGGGGRWNDADMMQVGNIGMNTAEQTTHFALWCLMASPLLIGADLTALDDTALGILNNTEMIDINQDSYGLQGVPVGHGASDAATAPCWAKPLANGDLAVMLLNTGDAAAEVSCSLAELGMPGIAATRVRDLWQHADLAPLAAGATVTTKLESHAQMSLRLTPAKRKAD
jgi:hypothetical protein